MQLSTMQDIGGCRAVLSSIDEVRRAEARLEKNRPPIRCFEYIVTPHWTGYRGVHIALSYPDRGSVERAIEVSSAPYRCDARMGSPVGRPGGRINKDLKSGRGPREVLDPLAAISEAMAVEKAGAVVPADLEARVGELRRAAAPYLVVRRHEKR